MGETGLGRRGALLGSMATVAAGQASADPVEAERAAVHAPFRAACLAWSIGARGRLRLPFTVDMTAPHWTQLRLAGVHPAIWVSLTSDGGMDVGVEWDDVFWDLLQSFDVGLEPTACGGWRNTLLIPEAQIVHPTREAGWSTGFETMLDWINVELAPATHLALWESRRGGVTWAELARDGWIMRWNRSLAKDRPPVHLLPVHGWTAT